jgi:hypothetical protein
VFTHFAFSDDSKHQAGEYNSLALVTFAARDAGSLKRQLDEILKNSQIDSEFKWTKLVQAKYRFAAQKIIDLVLQSNGRLRIDVLIWNINDSRHKNLREIPTHRRNDQ